MSKETKALATIPFPSFEGITFPRDYPAEIIDEGYVFDLGGRHLETFKIPDHAVGSLAFLDDKEGILFCGDELCMPFGKALNGSVEHVHKLLMKLWNRKEEIKILYGGPGKGETAIIGKLLENIAESAPVVYQRWMPHPPDRHHDDLAEVIYKRMMDYAGIKVIYDCRKIKENS